MIVVSNTTPLIGLASIQHFDLLWRLFGEIHISKAVYDEAVTSGREAGGAKRELSLSRRAVPPASSSCLRAFVVESQIIMPLDLTENYIAQRLKEAYQPGVVASTDGYAELLRNGTLKCAAVLMPLVQREGEWHLVFTRRTNDVEHHKGQVSFPGGACEAGETAEQTALREAVEEIGLQQADVRILGRLNDVVTITHYRVAPLVGVMPWPYRFQLSTVEVGCVFLIPLIWLTQRENWEEHLVTLDGALCPFPAVIYHEYEGEVVWGATARMVQNLIKVVFE